MLHDYACIRVPAYAHTYVHTCKCAGKCTWLRDATCIAMSVVLLLNIFWLGLAENCFLGSEQLTHKYNYLGLVENMARDLPANLIR